MRALVIEDDISTSRNICAFLVNAGMAVDTAEMGEEGLDLAKLYNYDIFILDLMLPDTNGLEVLKAMRAGKLHTPVLVLSGDANVGTRVDSLSSGADDYMTKPFWKEELLARVNAVVRRSRSHSHSVIQTGKMSVNLDEKTVAVDGIKVALTPSEYQMIEVLSLRKGVTLSKDMLLDKLYNGTDEPEKKIIDVFICTLRRKLSAATNGENYIATVWGHGYRLCEPDAQTAPCH